MILEVLEESFGVLESKLLKLRVERDLKREQKEKLESEVGKLEHKSGLLVKVGNLFEHLLDKMLDEKKNEVEKLVTYGLHTVFPDQKLKFYIDIKQKYNSIYTTFKTKQAGEIEGDVINTFGGGIVNVESFLLRLITLFQVNLAPFLFLDETFSHLSNEYVDNCSVLLRDLCKTMKVTIFLITHKEEMLNHADGVYKASIEGNELKLKRGKHEKHSQRNKK